MGVNYFDIDSIVDPNRLSTSIEYESIQGRFFTRFLRENYVASMGYEAMPPVGAVDKQNVNWSGAPIETWGDLEKGGTEIDVPLRMRYIGTPRSGRAPIQGTGEEVRWLFRNLKIWNYRKAFALLGDGSADDQILNEAMAGEINNRVRPAASEWLRDWFEGDINWSYLTGYSANLAGNIKTDILQARTDVTPFSHPNAFVAGYGRIQYGTTAATRPGGATYEETLVSALNAAIAANAGMTAARLIAFRNECARLNIPRVKVPGGGEYFIMIMKDSAYAQLEKDVNFRNDLIGSLPRDLRSNPFFSDVVAVYAQCLIFVNPTQFGVQRGLDGKVATESGSTINMPKYGPTNWMGVTGQAASFDTNDLASTLCIGPSGLNKVWGKVRIKFTMEVWEHEERKELGLKVWQTFVRSDYIDTLGKLNMGTNVFSHNDTSAVLFTFSPYTMTL